MLRRALLVIITACIPAGAYAQRGGALPLDIPKDLTPYFLVLYKQGPDTTRRSPAAADSLLRAHLAHLRAMMEQKKFIVAGPGTDGGSVIGVIIVAAKTLDEARELVGRDPRVRNGDLRAEFHAIMIPSLDAVTVRY